MNLNEMNLARIASLWRGVRDYFGAGGRKGRIAIVDAAGLRAFLQTRASMVAQTSLYGYVRTRAGVRFPELFHDDVFNEKLNTAKWQIWLACLSDLAVFAGGLMARRTGADRASLTRFMEDAFGTIIAETGTPPDAGPPFAAGIEQVRARLAMTDWAAIVVEDESAFSQSPEALLRWAPIVDTLKQYDGEIVKNSIRFRWQEVRRHLREDLDAAAVLGLAAPAGAARP